MASEVHAGVSRPIVQVDGTLTAGHRPEVIVVTASGATGAVDTELPAAAALSDALANPTAPMVGAALLTWDGSQFVRALGNSDKHLIAVPYQTSGGLNDGHADSRLRATARGGAVFLSQLVEPLTYEDSVNQWRRQRGVTQGTLLASAARTATTSSANQTNYNHRGVLIIVNVTAAPGAETLTPAVRAVDAISGNVVDLTAFGTITGTGTYAYTVYPGAAETAALANHEVQALCVPAVWAFRMVHSAAGSWTYSVHVSSLL